ncbi:allophanate hydrolase subunit 1 [Kitasatospora sp. GP82]|uniref:5-oxoprolinase subunit B family protein n=1 Tax=Kitasatospora sp. GP82 TaxID=3035089 RepID=UPI00247620C2|nr:allophanate hydrolase subunit 1 [Kitasatospora sp. GP82]MDH6128170.1 KipI family sensor histidine kinase inhibitor [Kitasatospora sp. GP82]
MTAEGLTLRQVGEDAVLVETDGIERATALYTELLARRGELPEITEIVPAARTVLLDGVADRPALLRQLTGLAVAPRPPAEGSLVEVPTVYDGADLTEVAALWGVSTEAAVRIHSEPEYRVAFCGFAPGFGYLTGLSRQYEVPRRPTPRSSVPAGAVALAGPFTGVYPRPSPGGWQLLGRTALPLWDVEREPPALLAPGTRVRFAPTRGSLGVPGRPTALGPAARAARDVERNPPAPDARAGLPPARQSEQH